MLRVTFFSQFFILEKVIIDAINVIETNNKNFKKNSAWTSSSCLVGEGWGGGWNREKLWDQPRPQGFSLKKWVGPHPFFKGKALGTRLLWDIPICFRSTFITPRKPIPRTEHVTWKHWFQKMCRKNVVKQDCVLSIMNFWSNQQESALHGYSVGLDNNI